MATLIPSISTCASRMTSGERRVAQRLEDKLDDDYLLWYDVPMGPKKACEYAVLVSLLEPESELYNSGIVDVSHRYPKMYVVRPQFLCR